MYRIIQAVRPDYIIGENVPGLLSIEGGMVFEQVCLDLESEGYEVQAFVLPACATGAPHRRDRVWIVGYSTNNGYSGGCTETGGEKREGEQRGVLEFKGANSGLTPDTEQIGYGGRSNANGIGTQREVHQDFGHDRNGIRSEIEGCDRVTENPGSSGCQHGINDQQGNIGNIRESGTGGDERDIDAEVNSDTGFQGHKRSEQPRTHGERPGQGKSHRPIAELYSGNYWHDWPFISPFHSGHDGLSSELVRHIRTSLAEAGETPENIEAYIRKEANWLRKQAIMAAGNAVVPTVVLQVMKAIQNHHERKTTILHFD